MAFDGSNGRFLVVWNDDRNGNWDVYGQIMNADGTPYGTATNINFPVSNLGTHTVDPSLTFDSLNNRYMVAWTDFRNQGTQSFDIYGQIVNADGSLFNTASNVNFIVSNNNGGQTRSMASYSRAEQRFLVAWLDTRGGLYGQYLQADGAAMGIASNVNFSVLNASIAKSVIEYNQSYANFPIAWETHTNPATIELLVFEAANPPDINVDPTTHDFGYVPVGTSSAPLTITVANNGTTPLFLENLIMSGSDPGQFTIQNDNVSGQTINPAANATFEVVLSPASSGRKMANITVSSNDPDEHFVIIFLNPALIPTLSEWGMILFALLLAGTAIWNMRQSKMSIG